MTNRLALETSPYLRQHQDNPVDWYPWGEEALTRARQENKPILLSIGYAACHWCHVMAHESFEDPATAAIMNRDFINIKVDREERPDLDHIYMTAVQALTGQGGWPMTMFLTPEGEPFYGGTYYPPASRYGMPAFQQVLKAVSDAWRTRPDEIARGAAQIAGQIGRIFDLSGGPTVDGGLFDRALQRLSADFDSRRGGFGNAPKFPPAMTLAFLLRMHARRGDAFALHMAEHTLQQMARGGMYDHLGGGFARYSVDADWLVPHFEKMLYDNALLARVYVEAWQATAQPLYRQVAQETLDWAVREMQDAAGGFYSSLDADSEGREGKFYVWDMAEIEAALDTAAPLFIRYYGVTRRGNWEGHNILHTPQALEDIAAEFDLTPAAAAERLAASRATLYARRAQRIWPGRDDKVLTAWNGLMLAALAVAGRAWARPDYTAAAQRCAEFLWSAMRRSDGRLLRTWKAGAEAKYNAYLEDYAYLAEALLALYETTFDERWFMWAQELASLMQRHFRDTAHGGFFDTSDDHEALLHRPKDIQDNATPSGNAMAARVLLQLGLYTGDNAHTDLAQAMTATLSPAMSQYPNAFAHWLGNAWLLSDRPRQVAVVGPPAAPETQALVAVVREGFRPNLVTAAGWPGQIPLLDGRTQLQDRPTAYVCENFACRLPVTSPEALRQQLAAASIA